MKSRNKVSFRLRCWHFVVIWGEGEVGQASGENDGLASGEKEAGTKLASSPWGERGPPPPADAANWSQPEQRWVATALEGEV